MSTYKTIIDEQFVLDHLKKNFDDSIEKLEFIKGGESSQAFSFDSDAGEFVVRVNAHVRPFYKDAYAHANFASAAVPIPDIIEIGKLDDTHSFAISRKAPGKTILALSDSEFEATLPDMLRILDDIHSMDIRDTSGYGKWDLESLGDYDSWRDFVLFEKKSDEREKLFENTFLERGVWQRIFAKIQELIDVCPEDRYLVHGDYGSSNVIAHESKVTGVLDWAESMYGDFVYDIAWMLFWQKNPEKFAQIKAHHDGRDIPNFEERLLCYQLRIALSSMGFFAFSNQKDKYEITKERALEMIKA